ncbi:DUF167 domain-containing protein [Candidatus Woesearchaeota archaeon]|nr:DUF167 domain-containing protein [Candidatus Woesearchaeota archaeon]
MNFPIKLKVKTKQKETKIISQSDSEIVLAVKSAPEKNKANLEVIKFLSKHFGFRIKIISGLKSKNKIISKEERSSQEPSFLSMK